MIWKIKNTKNYDDRIHIGFALIPLRLWGCDYRIWLESYFYYNVMYSVDGPIDVKRFRNINSALTSLSVDIDANEYIM